MARASPVGTITSECPGVALEVGGETMHEVIREIDGGWRSAAELPGIMLAISKKS